MKLLTSFLIAAGISSLISIAAPARAAAPESNNQITILYDAFGADPSMSKDWGFSALVEVAGKRILFDTGNDAGIFAANVKAKGVDLKTLDFVVLSHRHSDHMAGLNYVLSVNPTVKVYAPKEGFGIYGSSLPSSFYRKDQSLPPEMRYYGGAPPEVMKFGAAWQGANFELIDKTTEIAPGMTLIALVSDTPGTKELKELSLAVNTPEGVVLVVGCSHPGLRRIVWQPGLGQSTDASQHGRPFTGRAPHGSLDQEILVEREQEAGSLLPSSAVNQIADRGIEESFR